MDLQKRHRIIGNLNKYEIMRYLLIIVIFIFFNWFLSTKPFRNIEENKVEAIIIGEDTLPVVNLPEVIIVSNHK